MEMADFNVKRAEFVYHKITNVTGRLIARSGMILTNKIVKKSSATRGSSLAKMANVACLKILSAMGKKTVRIILTNRSALPSRIDHILILCNRLASRMCNYDSCD